MKRQIITTKDGSKTIQLTDWNEQYHSIHGAVQEAQHVFLKMGLWHILERNTQVTEMPMRILEMGFGTGLNAFLTFLESIQNNVAIDYTGVESYPITLEEAFTLDYPKQIGSSNQVDAFVKMHEMPWDESIGISDHFQLTKRKQRFEDIQDSNTFDLIYFDAFGARVQPELWTETIFKQMHTALKTNGVLVTYSAKGSVRRALQAVGFAVERLPGPPGKREMLRATKL